MTPERNIWRELERDWRTPEEVATLLDVDTSTVYRWLGSGILGGVRLGKKWRVSSGDMREFLHRERQRQLEKRPVECPLCLRRAECPWCGKTLDI